MLVRENDHFILCIKLSCIKLSSNAKIKEANAGRMSGHPQDSAALVLRERVRIRSAAAVVKYNDSGSHKNVPCPAPCHPLTPADRVYISLVMSLQT